MKKKRRNQKEKPGAIGRRQALAGLTAGLGLALAGLSAKRIARRPQASLKEADYYISLDRGGDES